MSVGDIRIKLALDGASAVVKDIEHVKAQIGGMAKSVAALGGVLSVGALAAWVSGAIGAADEMSKLSAKTGVAVKDVAGLQLAFRQSGVAAEQFVPVLAKLGVAAVNGNKALDAMGVSARNTDGTLKSTRQLLGEVADKFAGYENGAAKTALSVGLLGEEGAKLLPLLNGGSAALDEFDAMAQKLGLTLDAETAKQAEKFNDTLDLMGQGVQGVGRQIAAQLLPTLSGLAGQFFESMTSGDRLTKVTGFLSAALRGLYVVGVGVIEIFSTVGKTLGGVSAAVVAALSGDFSGAANILRDMKNDIGAGWKTTLSDITAAWNTTGNASVEAMASTTGAAQRAAPEVAKVAKATKEVKDEFADLLNKLSAKDAGLDPSFYKDLEILYQGYVKNRIGTDDYRAAVEKLIGAQQFAKDIAKESAQALADSTAAQNKAYDDAEAAEAKQIKVVEDRIKAARLMHESLQQDIRLQGMSAKERQVATAMLELERQGVVKGTEAYEKYATQIREAIEIKAANDEHIKMWESIDQTAHDVFVNIFEDGAGTFKRLGQTLKASLLDWLYQMTIKKWIINISGQFTGGVGGAAAQMGSGGGVLSSLGNVASSVSSFFDTGGAVLGSMAASTAAYAAAVPGLTSMAAGSQAAMLAAQTGVFGTSGLAATAAAGGGGAMAGIAAAAPYLAAVLAVVALAKKFKSPGEQHTGGFYSSSGATGMDAALGITDGNEAWARDMIKRANPEIEGFVKTTVDSVISATQANAKALGMDIAVGIDAGFASNTNGKGKDKNNFGYFDITVNGETVAEYMNRTLGTDLTQSVAQWTADMADAAAQWVLGGEEAWKALAHQGEGASATLDRVVLSLGSVNQMFDMLGHQIELTGIEGATAAAQFADLFGGLQQAQLAVGAYYSEFYSDAERSAYTTRMLTGELDKLGLQMPTTRDQFKGMVDAAIAAGDTELAAKLMAFSSAMASILLATEDATAALEQQAEAAFEVLQRSVAAEQNRLRTAASVASESVSSLTGLINTIKGGIDALYSGVESVAAQRAAQGKAFIAQALATARVSGYLPESAALGDAISAVTADPTQYANSTAAAYERLKTAGQLMELRELGGEQLDTASRQLRALQDQIDQNDRLLDFARTQIDVLRGVDTSVLTVAEAMQKFYDRTFEEGAFAPEAPSSGATGSAGGGSGDGDGFVVGPGPSSASTGDWRDAIRSYADTLSWLGTAEQDVGSARELAAWAKGRGFGQSAIASALGFRVQDVEAFFATASIPKFDVGTDYVPRDMLARIHEGEQIVPKAYNPHANAQLTSVGNAELVRLLSAVLQVMSRNAEFSQQTADVLNRVTRGGNGMVTTPAPLS